MTTTETPTEVSQAEELATAAIDLSFDLERELCKLDPSAGTFEALNYLWVARKSLKRALEEVQRLAATS